MGVRWRRTSETGNDGRALTVWVRDGYEICQHIGVHKGGKFVRWDFEVTARQGRSRTHVGVASSLRGAKSLVRNHDACASIEEREDNES